MCNCKSWCENCPSCIDLGYKCEDCKDKGCGQCHEFMSECAEDGPCGRACVCCTSRECSGRDCARGLLDLGRGGGHVCNCLSRVPSALMGLAMLGAVLWLYWMKTLIEKRAQESMDTLQKTVAMVNATLGQVGG